MSVPPSCRFTKSTSKFTGPAYKWTAKETSSSGKDVEVNEKSVYGKDSLKYTSSSKGKEGTVNIAADLKVVDKLAYDSASGAIIASINWIEQERVRKVMNSLTEQEMK